MTGGPSKCVPANTPAACQAPPSADLCAKDPVEEAAVTTAPKPASNSSGEAVTTTPKPASNSSGDGEETAADTALSSGSYLVSSALDVVAVAFAVCAALI